ncbi:hypothetical protein BOX15_Mlig002440g3 [Macrostomum lignano]|uniref:Uncharacterized protein n=1 Tax=Macrostomum lignano TaxID=282301 RepID=A0A267GZM8_9PLAT|nr:hypothetical protein BOX15_Mlig002440g3 [Macrostomum lignano]
MSLKTRRIFKRLTFNTRFSLWSLVILSIACLSCTATILWFFNHALPSDYMQYAEALEEEHFNAIINSLPPKTEEFSKRNCQSPNLPLETKFIHDHRPVPMPADFCSKAGGSAENWLRVSESRVYLKPKFSGSSCTAEPVVWLDDQSSEFGSARPLRSGDELPSLGFRASCQSPDRTSRHSSVYYGVKRATSSAAGSRGGSPTDSSELGNVIMLGLDSLSRLESLRSLPRASRIMQDRLGAITLQQYNIMGDGTPAALLPILTGVREADMPESRKGFAGARFLDDSLRWIFQDLRDRGFVTLYGEEQSAYGTFQLRFHGFRREPTDFYLRPALLQQERLQTNAICIGDEIASARMLSTVKDLFTLYPDRPKFAFTFFSSLSHENQDLSPMDAELVKFLDWFEAANLSSNTSIILMSDHGQRHGPLRNSMQGKLEESLPLMSIALSRQLMSRKKDAAEMLRTNANRLTTPVDIHRTLLNLSGLRDSTTLAAGGASLTSYSLIDEAVPETRSCSDAGIPTHWCSCLRLKKIQEPSSNELAVRAARFAVNQMNSATEPFRHLCHELQLGNVTEADVSLASEDLARRERHVSWRYVAYNAENSALLAAGYLTLRLVTEPNGGLFEASVQFGLQRSRFGNPLLLLSSTSEASRINRYGSQAHCVTEVAPHLRKFCLCRTGVSDSPS